jgi:RHS repeat-associated protein
MPTSYKFIPRFAALTRDVPPTSAPKIQWGYMTTTLHAEGKRAGVSPLLARFISPDSIVPRPGDVQAFNRYAYASWNPMRQVDTNGHADRDPQNDSLCQALPMVCAPQSPPLANETQMGESMSVQQAPIMTSKGAQVTLFAAKSGKDGNDGKGSGGGGLLGALLRLLGLGGDGGAGKVAQEVAKDGDPTNELVPITDKVRSIAAKVADSTGGTLDAARGSGWTVKVSNATNKGFDITIRIMTKGGQRSDPYFRVSVAGKGALDSSGQANNNQALTHFSLYADDVDAAVKQVLQVVNAGKDKY